MGFNSAFKGLKNNPNELMQQRYKSVYWGRRLLFQIFILNLEAKLMLLITYSCLTFRLWETHKPYQSHPCLCIYDWKWPHKQGTKSYKDMSHPAAMTRNMGRAMTEAVTSLSLKMRGVWNQASLCPICSGRSGTGTGFSLSILVFPYHYHSTIH